MVVDDLLLELSRRGVSLRLEGGKLGVHAPQGALNEELRTALSANRARLLAMLQLDAGAISESGDGGASDMGQAIAELVKNSRRVSHLSFESLKTMLNVAYTWDYSETKPKLRELYDKAVHGQWLSDEVLPWRTEVNPELPIGPENLMPLWGSDVWRRMAPSQRSKCTYEMNSWLISQFVHGEQSALLGAAQLVNCLTDIDSKLHAAMQVAEEARHVDVFGRYLNEKIGQTYPANLHVKALSDLVFQDCRWDMKFLGVQIMGEGLALASFMRLRDTARDPLLREILTFVLGDEARHLAFGVLSLRDYYHEQSPAFRKEREDFVFESARILRDRFLYTEVWEKLGLPVKRCTEIVSTAPGQVIFRQILFGNIVPTIGKLGLMTERMSHHFSELGILPCAGAADLYFRSWEQGAA